jgi:hypothetical protein
MLKNWKTTSAGVALILGALADAFTQASHGFEGLDVNRLYADGAAIVAGWGLIVAKDHNS